MGHFQELLHTGLFTLGFVSGCKKNIVQAAELDWFSMFPKYSDDTM